MKRWLKWAGMGAAVVIGLPALLWISGYVLPAEIELELEHRVDATPEDLYPLITTYDGVTAWWQRANEAMGETFEIRHLSGPEAGVGMHLGFATLGGDVFEEWTMTDLEHPSTVKMDVDFMGVFVSERTVELTPEGEGTLVHWSEAGRVESPLWRWLLRIFKGSAIENRRNVLDAAATLASTTTR